MRLLPASGSRLPASVTGVLEVHWNQPEQVRTAARCALEVKPGEQIVDYPRRIAPGEEALEGRPQICFIAWGPMPDDDDVPLRVGQTGSTCFSL
jgi:hypothetical protein